MGFGSDTAAVVVDTSICAGAKVAAAGACACRCCVVPAVLIASERRMIMLGWSLLSPSRREASPLLCPGCRSMVLTEKCMMSDEMSEARASQAVFGGMGMSRWCGEKTCALFSWRGGFGGCGMNRDTHSIMLTTTEDCKMVGYMYCSTTGMVTVEQLRSYYDCKAGR